MRYTFVDFIGTGQVLYKDGVPIMRREDFRDEDWIEALQIEWVISNDNYSRSYDKPLDQINRL
jgi:hypothetical protein